MRSNFVRPLAVVLVLSAPLLAQEKEKKPMEMPKPPAELSQLAIFGGTWSCNGTTFANPMGPEHKTAATVKGSMDLGGMWMHVSYDEKKTAQNAMPFHARMFMGWNAAEKKLVEHCFDAMGGACTQTSAGWSGDTLVFEGTGIMGGQKMGARDTFTKKGSNQLTHMGEMQGPDGTWTKTDEETCTKGAVAKK